MRHAVYPGGPWEQWFICYIREKSIKIIFEGVNIRYRFLMDFGKELKISVYDTEAGVEKIRKFSRRS